MKSNPLFFDSTKFRGDIIIVDIELSGVELKDGEELFVRVFKTEGESVVTMRENGLNKWLGQSRMEYQQQVELEFFINLNGELVECSERRKATAAYCINQRWERIVKDELEALINGPTLIENANGVFEPLLPAQAAVPEYNRNLPMIIPIKVEKKQET